ncbi:MAG: heavy-metal-associated domain-containing protein [Methylophilus sp.]|jgi:copper chaperone
MEYTLLAPNISCGGCANAVTGAIVAADALAVVDINVESKVLKVKTELADSALLDLMKNTGYPATLK